MNSRVVNNTSWLISCRIIQSLLSIVVSMMTSRYLGPSNYGIINYAMSVVNFVIPIVNLGITNVLVQELVADRDAEGKILGTCLLLNLISSVFCMIAVIMVAIVANPGDKVTIFVCALHSLSLFSMSIGNVSYWFQSKLLSKYIALLVLISHLLISVYKVFLLINGMSIYWFAVSSLLEHTFVSFGSLVFYYKLGGKKMRFSFEKAKSLLAKGKFYILSSMMITIFSQTDKIMLKAMLDDAQVGYYSAAISCCGLTTFIFCAIIDSMRPVIFEKKKVSEYEYELNLKRLYSVIIYFALGQSVLMTLFAKPLVLILYGSAYIPAINTTRIAVWYTTFSYIGSVRNIWVLQEGKYGYLWIIDVSGALLNVIVNMVFIPVWGIYGAALATILTQVFANVVVTILVKPLRPSVFIMGRSLNPKYIKEMVGILLKRKSTV